jgi:hypothetical protein
MSPKIFILPEKGENTSSVRNFIVILGRLVVSVFATEPKVRGFKPGRR